MAKNFKTDTSAVGIAHYILLFLVGVVAAATMVIPGVSGSFVLMLLGYYNNNVIKERMN